jgi:hypothetical protein
MHKVQNLVRATYLLDPLFTCEYRHVKILKGCFYNGFNIEYDANQYFDST